MTLRSLTTSPSTASVQASAAAALPIPGKKPSVKVATALPEFEQLLDSEEAAALLKIHPKTLQRMARNNEIAAVQIGKLWRFRASALNEWLAQKLVG